MSISTASLPSLSIIFQTQTQTQTTDVDTDTNTDTDTDTNTDADTDTDTDADTDTDTDRCCHQVQRDVQRNNCLNPKLLVDDTFYYSI